MYSLLFLLVLTGGYSAEESPALPSSILESDLEGIASSHITKEHGDIKHDGYLQYGPHELAVHYDEASETSEITCAAENSKCRFYDNVEQTWKETERNTIYFNGEMFFQRFSGVIRDHLSNSFSLLLTLKRTDQEKARGIFLMSYKPVENFVEEHKSDGKAMDDMKVLYLDGTTVSPADPNPVIKSKMVLDARLKVEGGKTHFKSSTGIFTCSDLYGIRHLEPQEYLFYYAHKKPALEDHPLTITGKLVKEDLSTLDPELKCSKRGYADRVIGFLEYKGNVLNSVYCEDKQYSFRTGVEEYGRRYNVHIVCPLPGAKKNVCWLKEFSHGRLVKKRIFNDDHQMYLGYEPTEDETPSYTLSEIQRIGGPIVHYFHLDPKFKLKMHAMLNLYSTICSKGYQGTKVVTMQSPSEDLTVPVTFGCQKDDIQIGEGEMVLVDNELMEFLPVHGLFYNPVESVFKCVGATTSGNCGPEAIRAVGSTKTLRKLDNKKEIGLQMIMNDLQELRGKYLEAVKVNPNAKVPLKVDYEVLAVIHGQTVINDMEVVEINAHVVCGMEGYNQLYFSGQDVLAYIERHAKIDRLDPEKCWLWIKNVEQADSDFDMGITYYTEKEFPAFIQSFTNTIAPRCMWFDEKGVFRVVVYNDKLTPVIEGLYDCSYDVYLIKGPFDVLRDSVVNAKEEDVFVFALEESWAFSANDVFAIKLLGSRDIPDLDEMGPPIALDDGWAISMQLLVAF